MDKFRVVLNDGYILGFAGLKWVARLKGGFYYGLLRKEVLIEQWDKLSEKYLFIERVSSLV